MLTKPYYKRFTVQQCVWRCSAVKVAVTFGRPWLLRALVVQVKAQSNMIASRARPCKAVVVQGVSKAPAAWHGITMAPAACKEQVIIAQKAA